VATDNDFEFPNPHSIGISLYPATGLPSTRSEWYLAESDVGGKDVA